LSWVGFDSDISLQYVRAAAAAGCCWQQDKLVHVLAGYWLLARARN
jgi:hypothetical protein